MVKRRASGSERLAESDGFLYRSVSKKLRNLIDNGTYPPSAQLPSAIELAEEFGVSTITIRRAIRDLSLAGHLMGRQGLGVFVANKRRIVRMIKTGGMAPFEDDVRKAGLAPGIQLLQMTIADGIDNAPFDLGKLGIGYRLDKVIFADDEPFVIDSSWLPKRVGDKLMPKLREHFISPLIEAHASFDHFDYLFQASTATEEQAALLKVMAGFPVLRAHYVAIGRNGRPLLVGCSTSRGDRLFYKLQTDTHRAQSKWRNNKQK